MHVCGTKSYWELWNDKSVAITHARRVSTGSEAKSHAVPYVYTAHHTCTHRVVCCSIDHILVNL